MRKLFFTFSYLLTIVAFSQTPATNGEARIKSLEQKKQLQQKSPFNKVGFKNIGPTVMSGRVVDIEANPDDPSEFYVAYASGGVWHTKNNGQSFKPIFDSTDVLIIGDIAVNWTSTNRAIWVGTGEVNSSRSSYAGVGVYKSMDNGKTWQYVGLPESHHIGKIQLHPSNPNVAWIAVLGHLYTPNKERGVYKTIDGGRTWKQQLFVDENTGCVELDINPQNPNEVYAAFWYRTRAAWQFVESGATSAIYKSNDGGETWNNISGVGSGFMEGNKIGRIGLCVFPNNPNIVYAIVDNNMPKPDTNANKVDSFYKKELFKSISKEDFLNLKNNLIDSFLVKNRFPRKYTAVSIKQQVKEDKIQSTALYDYLDSDDGFQNSGIHGCEVYRSDDAGKTWKKTHDKPISIFNTYGYYFAKIYTSYTNPNKVFILGFYAQVSNNGGKTFTTMDKGNVHADHHALWVNPKRDSHVINGNDGGCNISYDDGEHWFKANTPAVGQFYAITTDDLKPYNVYGGLQDNGCWYFTSNPSTSDLDGSGLGQVEQSTKSLGGGDGMYVQVDTRDNNTVYYGSQFGFYARKNKLSTNRRDVKTITPIHELGEKPLRYNWQTPIHLSRHNQDVLYYGANKFYRSLVKGDTMICMSSELTNGKKAGNVPYGTITSIAESPIKFGLLYAGTDDGNLHVSQDGGFSWQPLSLAINNPTSNTKNKKQKPEVIVNTIPQNLWVSRIVASNHVLGRVYVTLNGYRFDDFAPYVFMSNDFGLTWQNITTNLPMESVNVIREDALNDSLLYVGTDGGLYVSNTLGNNWHGWNKGLPQSVPVHDIAIQTKENEIVLGTHGRSVYIAKLKEVQNLATAMPVANTKVYENIWEKDLVKKNKKTKVVKEKDIPCPTVRQ